MIGWVLFGLAAPILLFCLWYIKELLIRFRDHQEISQEMYLLLDNYREHLTSVYQMETFYGDATLQGLLEHTKDTAASLDEYSKIFILEEEVLDGEPDGQ